MGPRVVQQSVASSNGIAIQQGPPKGSLFGQFAPSERVESSDLYRENVISIKTNTFDGSEWRCIGDGDSVGDGGGDGDGDRGDASLSSVHFYLKRAITLV